MSHGPSSPPGHRRGEDHIENRYRARRDRHTCRRPISCSRSEELLDLGILAAGATRDGHVGGSAVAPEPTVAAVERRFQNRSEERRVGKEGTSTVKYRGGPDH